MRRPDKGLGLTASRLLQGWATGERRKLPMPPNLQGDKAVEAICAVIRRIPRGWVATYGQVATMAGMPRRARLVGRVLQRLDPATKVPWCRCGPSPPGPGGACTPRPGMNDRASARLRFAARSG